MTGFVNFSRGILYEDASAIETGISFDPTYRCRAGHSYFEIEGADGVAYVRVSHIPQLIGWMQDIVAEDTRHRGKSKKAKP